MDDNSSSIDQRLLQSYLNTDYRVFQPPLELIIGDNNPLLNEFLIDNNCYSWAFVSSSNPDAKSLQVTENDRRLQYFKENLGFNNWRFCEGLSISKVRGDNSPQKHLFILDIELQKAVQLARMFDQKAILFGELGGVVELIWC